MTASTTAAGRPKAASGLGVAVLCMLLNLVDGFDLLIVSFVLPTLPQGYATTVQMGLLVSMGLVGMAVGAIGLAPLADRFGRRIIALSGIAVNLLGLVMSAVSPSAEVMMLARFITGVGIGMVSVVIVIAAQESVMPRLRNLATGLVMIGYPLGSVVAALSSDAIRSTFGENWHAMYLAGATLALVALLAAFFGLPESVKAAEERFEQRAETKLSGDERSPHLLGKDLMVITLLLCVGYMTVSGVFNFAAGLTPTFVKSAYLKGMDSTAMATATKEAGNFAQSVGLALALGCLVGAISLATIGLVVRATRLAWIYSAIAVASMVGFAASFPEAGQRPEFWMYFFATALGIGIFGGISSYSALIPFAYPPLVRAKGYGAMLGFGRAGGIIAPLITAWAVAKVSAQQLYNITNIGLIVSLLCAVALVVVLRNKARAKHFRHSDVRAAADLTASG